MAWLLDTHALIWQTDNPSRLSDTARACIAEFPAEIYVSVASIWEIAIKRSTGKLDLPASAMDLFQTAQQANTPILDILGQHVAMVESMPFHHRDPFDRLLAAQALAEDLTLISRDTIFDSYGVRRIW